MPRRDRLADEVLAALQSHQAALETGARNDMQAHVYLPVAHSTENEAQRRERQPL